MQPEIEKAVDCSTLVTLGALSFRLFCMKYLMQKDRSYWLEKIDP